MLTTHELIDLAKQQLAIRYLLTLPMSDYRLAQLLDVQQTTMSNWRTGKTRISVEYIDRFARACDLREEYVLACLEAERAKSPMVRSIYERIAERFRPAVNSAVLGVAAILAVAALAGFPSRSEASTFLLVDGNIHTANSRRSRMRRFLARALGHESDTNPVRS